MMRRQQQAVIRTLFSYSWIYSAVFATISFESTERIPKNIYECQRFDIKRIFKMKNNKKNYEKFYCFRLIALCLLINNNIYQNETDFDAIFLLLDGE